VRYAAFNSCCIFQDFPHTQKYHSGMLHAAAALCCCLVLLQEEQEEEEQHDEGSDVDMDEAERAADARMGYTEQDEGERPAQLWF
jgi:hypothetical protein